MNILDIDDIEMIKEIREMLTDSVPILFLIDYDKDNTKEVEQVLCIKNTNTLINRFLYLH